MAKYSDRRSARRSKIVPYIPDETPEHRHARRLGAAVRTADELREWCSANGWTFAVHNGVDHFAFRRGDTMLDWWPRTAKLVINKQWNKGIHCHDYQQVIKFLVKNSKETMK